MPVVIGAAKFLPQRDVAGLFPPSGFPPLPNVPPVLVVDPKRPFPVKPKALVPSPNVVVHPPNAPKPVAGLGTPKVEVVVSGFVF